MGSWDWTQFFMYISQALYLPTMCILSVFSPLLKACTKNAKQWFSSCAHSIPKESLKEKKYYFLFWIVFKFVDTSTISTIVGFYQTHIGIGVSELNKTLIQTTEEEKVNKPLHRIFWDVRSLNKVLDRGRQCLGTVSNDDKGVEH